MVKKVVIRDGRKNIVSILYLEEDSKLSYRKSFTVDGTRLMQVELYLEDRYIGSINCWEGTIEEGIFIEKEV